MHIEWIDDQPNILAQQPCDQRAAVDGRAVWVRYDYPGRAWFIIMEPDTDPALTRLSHETRDDARSYAEQLLGQPR